MLNVTLNCVKVMQFKSPKNRSKFQREHGGFSQSQSHMLLGLSHVVLGLQQ